MFRLTEWPTIMSVRDCWSASLVGDVADVLALAQHGHAVGDLQHLVQLMRDDDEGLAVGLHVAHDGEELVRLLRGQHGGGLVQDEDVRARGRGP